MSNEENTHKRMKIGDFAKIAGVSVSTVRNWEKQNLIHPIKLPSGHRIYDDSNIEELVCMGVLKGDNQEG